MFYFSSMCMRIVNVSVLLLFIALVNLVKSGFGSVERRNKMTDYF
jgi:hypothetical protein